MRLLKFNVDKQKLEKDPECDFTNLVAGTQNYLKAYFNLTEDWENYTVIAQFWRGSDEYSVLLENKECIIPSEVLVGSTFRVNLLGAKGKTQILTNRVSIRQEVNR